MIKEKGTGFLIFLYAFYVIIAAYIFFSFVKTDVIERMLIGIFFEISGFFLTFVFGVRSMMNFQNIKTGYMIPMVVCTVLYAIFMNALNFFGGLSLSIAGFALFHMLLLFAYMLIVIPMYVMGKQ